MGFRKREYNGRKTILCPFSINFCDTAFVLWNGTLSIIITQLFKLESARNSKKSLIYPRKDSPLYGLRDTFLNKIPHFDIAQHIEILRVLRAGIIVSGVFPFNALPNFLRIETQNPNSSKTV
jgi:hypothetical protein